MGVAAAHADEAARAIFHRRIKQGMYDGLSWFTHERADRATDPRSALDGAASVITLAAPYRTRLEPGVNIDSDGRLRGRIARYAWGRDYHRVLERRLTSLRAFIESEYGGRSRALVDYAPLAERAYAARAGIGWFGKNTNMLLPGVGSWVLLAEIVTTVAFAPDQPLQKSCGACTRCVMACPTGAISAAYVVDNQRCISFHTIENRGWIPRALRPQMGDWVFGCDLCQDVCPVGMGKEAATLPELAPSALDDALPELTELLELDEEQFRARFQGRSIMRAKRHGLARNTCVALGNLGDERAVPALARALREDPEPIVRGHAAWALARIGGAAAIAALRDAAAAETAETVLDEITTGLDGRVPPADRAGVLEQRGRWLLGPSAPRALNRNAV